MPKSKSKEREEQPAGQDIISKLYTSVLKGIETYQKKPRIGKKTHLKWFSQRFDSNRGLHRAEFYKAALHKQEYNDLQKLLLIYALLASKDGSTLQKDVAQAMNDSGDILQARNVIIALIDQNHISKDARKTGQIREFNQIVSKIVHFANTFNFKASYKYDSSSKTTTAVFDYTLPEKIWNGINRKRYYAVAAMVPWLTKYFGKLVQRKISKSEVIHAFENDNKDIVVFENFASAESYSEMIKRKSGLMLNTHLAPIFTLELKEDASHDASFLAKAQGEGKCLTLTHDKVRKLVRADFHQNVSIKEKPVSIELNTELPTLKK